MLNLRFQSQSSEEGDLFMRELENGALPVTLYILWGRERL